MPQKKTDPRLLSKVFYNLPKILGKKVIYPNIDREMRTQPVRDAIGQLSLAKIVYKVHHAHANGIPLQGEVNDRVFKIIFLDVGLVQSIVGLNPLDIEGWHRSTDVFADYSSYLIHEGENSLF